MGHYFINDETLGSKKNKLTYTFLGVNVELYSDLGVFSKDHIDFGTNVLLNNLEIKDNVKSILDVGCGYGIVGISIAKKFSEIKVKMIDINERCIKLTNENIKINKLDNASCCSSNLYENVNEQYDMIISNPPIRAGKDIVTKVVTDGYNHLNEGGSIWIVIQKKQGAPSLKSKMEEVFGNVEVVAKDKGYYILTSKKNEFN